jgi:hypothetical protein
MAQGRPHKRVVVVGAGVSGCACAAALAGAGAEVTLVNSAMDRVGLPTYGPDLQSGLQSWTDLESAFMEVPEAVRRVWLEAASRPLNDQASLNVDRRRVSVELKRVLEGLSGLEFRQGFVVDLRRSSAGAQVEVETIFGEVFAADAAVVAVGLSLDGHYTVGEDRVRGGRYGEPESEGLYQALLALGAEFAVVCAVVGATVSGPSARELVRHAGLKAGVSDSTRVESLVPVYADGLRVPWPAGYPEAPHLDQSLRGTEMMLATRAPGPLESRGPASERVVLSPDEGCGDEAAVAVDLASFAGALDGVLAGGEEGTALSPEYVRMPLIVRARAVTSLGAAGRLLLPGSSLPVWICGRAAGSPDYLESLLSGVRVAKDVSEWGLS